MCMIDTSCASFCTVFSEFCSRSVRAAIICGDNLASDASAYTSSYADTGADLGVMKVTNENEKANTL